jgi:AcrR family transcriptional regulator
VRTRKRPVLVRRSEQLPEPAQERSRGRRADLLNAALATFAADGYERTSVSALCERAGLPVGTFYQHFRSKRQMLLALMDELVHRLDGLDLQLGGDDPKSAIRRLLEGAFAVEHRYIGAHRAWREAALVDAEIARRQRAIRLWTSSRVAFALRLMQRMPHARPEVDVDTLAPVLDEVFWSLLFQPSLHRADERARMLRAVTRLVYHAMFRDPND